MTPVRSPKRAAKRALLRHIGVRDISGRQWKRLRKVLNREITAQGGEAGISPRS